MTLIVEDGSIVENSNTFVNRADFIQYAALTGVTLPNNSSTDILLIKAFQFINSYEGKLKGFRVSRSQSAPYPRSSLKIQGWAWSTSEIPTLVIECQNELALELNSGADLYNPTFSKGPRIEETVSGAVTVKYATTSTVSSRVKSRALKLLDELLKTPGFNSIQLVRS